MLSSMPAPAEMQTRARLGVIILGAGASSRMGRPKLLLPWRDSTVIGGLISQWRELEAAQVAVVMRPNDFALAAELDRLSLTVRDRIENPRPEEGMFSSIVRAAGWDGWQPGLTHWAVVLGDQPHLQTETLRQLLKCSRQYPDAICQPVQGDRAGHPVILPRAEFTSLKTTPAATLKEFLKLEAARCVQCPVTDGGLLLDLDTPEDYKRLINSH